MDHRLLGWSAPEGPEGDDEEEDRAIVEAVSVPMIRPLKDLDAVFPQAPPVVDRRDFLRALNDALDIDPRRTAVITIDCQRSHLDLAVATMPVSPQAAATVVAATARLLRFARGCGMSVVHVLSQNRILPKGQPEALCNPFWAAVERSHHSLIPDRDSNVGRHNLVGTVQTQLMPELGPEPGDVLVDRKRRISIYRDTDLDLTLRELGVDTVVLAGVDTSTSVLCAAFESLNRDLRTIVVSDCVQSLFGDDLHFFGLQNVARCLGWVLTVDELMAKV
ncbi:MAG TPA: cysteine hydrolase [Terriglobales bacterium]|nr:cysteine hydrolase [Terriglobales bacterium]